MTTDSYFKPITSGSFVQIKKYGNTYYGTVIGGAPAIEWINKVGRKSATVEFKLADGRVQQRKVRVVRTREEFNRAGFGCVLLPLPESK